MGAASSYSLIGNQLVQLSNKQATSTKNKTATDFLKTVHEVSPWILISGDLSIVDGKQVWIDLQRALHRDGLNAVSTVSLSLCPLVKESLLSNIVEVKKQAEEAKAAFSEAQNQESVRSLQVSNDTSFGSSPSYSGNETKESEEIERDVKLKHKLKKCSLILVLLLVILVLSVFLQAFLKSRGAQ